MLAGVESFTFLNPRVNQKRTQNNAGQRRNRSGVSEAEKLLSDMDEVLDDRGWDTPTATDDSSTESDREGEDSGDEIAKDNRWQGMDYAQVTTALREQFDMTHYVQCPTKGWS